MNSLLVVSSIVVLIALFYLIFRVSALVGLMKEKDRSAETKSNNRSAVFLLIFLFLFIGGFWWYFFFAQKDLLPISASVHGQETDDLFKVVIGVILVPFTILNILVFYTAFKFRYRKGTYADYYPHNNKLEIIWTIVPGLVFTALIIMGTRVWSKMTAEPPKEAEVINVMGYQFAWGIRYAGNDDTLGTRDFRLTDPVNEFGMDLSDPNSYDDFTALEMHIPKGKPVLLHIIAKDVIHSVFMPHFRLKMDAVPGMPTKFWFTPKYTTEEMRQMTGNPDFNYEMACTEICGRGHFAMRMVVVVEEPAAYENWKSSQASWLKRNPSYLSQVPDNLQEMARIKSGIEDQQLVAANK